MPIGVVIIGIGRAGHRHRRRMNVVSWGYDSDSETDSPDAEVIITGEMIDKVTASDLKE